MNEANTMEDILGPAGADLGVLQEAHNQVEKPAGMNTVACRQHASAVLHELAEHWMARSEDMRRRAEQLVALANHAANLTGEEEAALYLIAVDGTAPVRPLGFVQNGEG